MFSLVVEGSKLKAFFNTFIHTLENLRIKRVRETL